MLLTGESAGRWASSETVEAATDAGTAMNAEAAGLLQNMQKPHEDAENAARLFDGMPQLLPALDLATRVACGVPTGSSLVVARVSRTRLRRSGIRVGSPVL
ncbi:hypothetical protein ABZY20_18990 [Streptomyces sp. NPDC006624]|uniref:hypothetical protein n=1 Tax=Streptomyces sp. NPDC006624 TaxID=3154892 RepID=UPI0033AD821A